MSPARSLFNKEIYKIALEMEELTGELVRDEFGRRIKCPQVVGRTSRRRVDLNLINQSPSKKIEKPRTKRSVRFEEDSEFDENLMVIIL